MKIFSLLFFFFGFLREQKMYFSALVCLPQASRSFLRQFPILCTERQIDRAALSRGLGTRQVGCAWPRMTLKHNYLPPDARKVNFTSIFSSSSWLFSFHASLGMATGTHRPSISRFPSVSFSKQSSVNSDGFFDDADDVDSARTHDRQEEAEKGSAIWSTTRRKLTLVSLCLVYFAATASFAILSPFFPSEVNNIMTSLLNRALNLSCRELQNVHQSPSKWLKIP